MWLCQNLTYLVACYSHGILVTAQKQTTFWDMDSMYLVLKQGPCESCFVFAWAYYDVRGNHVVNSIVVVD